MQYAWTIFFIAAMSQIAPAEGPQVASNQASVKRGFEFLTKKVYMPPDFTQQVIDDVWTVWPEPLRSEAEKADPARRREMTFSRYGLTPREDDPAKALQYVVDSSGNWIMNCFACHAGKVAGRTIPGLPNSHFALATLTEETRKLKLTRELPLARMDVGSIFVPLGETNGTTNAVMFGVVLMNHRDAELNWHERSRPKLTNHDLDAPPWWHFRRKKMLYIDGFAAKGHRSLMQFMLVRQNGPEKFREWEPDFQDVYAYMSSLTPPAYPFEIDREKAKRGAAAFNRHCVECHGTYGPGSEYPERMIEIEHIGTDRVRFEALTRENRASYGRSWFNEFGAKPCVESPAGYVAPPLDGIWASAPYLHNGSVPTLHHLLHSLERPVVWRRTENGYDRQLVGLEIETYKALPRDMAPAERRTYFDTSEHGKSSEGHRFVDRLTPTEKDDVLEYLKTL